ncbi:MAG: glycoside hydrolase family 5 protein [Ruminococcus sp.]|nr:glycoside hydrolase family 5 protein [Ruminococcus sp.]
MKIRALIITAAMLLFTGCGSSGSSDSSESQDKAEMRSLTAAEAAKEMGLGWNLGNTMEAYDATNCEKSSYKWIPVKGENKPSDYETCWGAPVTTQEMIDGVKAAGFSTVRIPVFWGNMMQDDGTWTINSDYMARVKEIVDYCMKDDLYAVVNIHHFDEFIIRRNSLEDCKKIFSTLWTQIAECFKDYNEKLVFEGYNEYLGGDQFNDKGELTAQSKEDAYTSTNALNQTFVDAVRSTGGNNAQRVLIVSGYWTNIDNTTSDKFVMPTDTAENRLMVSVHYVDNMMYWTNQIGGDNWVGYTDSQIALLDKAFGSRNIPVFLGETTSRYPGSNFAGDAKSKTSSECLEIVLDKLTEHGFVPVLWDVTDNFYSRDTCTVKDADDAQVIKKISEKLKTK